jgi:hypothetical protein
VADLKHVPARLAKMRGTLLVSDAERERAVALLHQHWLAGRLSLEQLDERMGEACAAPDEAALRVAMRDLPVPVAPPPQFVAPPPAVRANDGGAVAGLVCGIVGLTVLMLSFGLLSILTVPLSATAWGLGRSSRRAAQAAGLRHGVATAGEVLGIVGTAHGTVILAGCAALFL